MSAGSLRDPFTIAVKGAPAAEPLAVAGAEAGAGPPPALAIASSASSTVTNLGDNLSVLHHSCSTTETVRMATIPAENDRVICGWSCWTQRSKNLNVYKLMCGCVLYLMEEREAGELRCPSIKTLRHKVHT